MPGSVIVGGARTPIGKLSGALKSFTAMDLGGFAITAALERSGISGDQVDYVIMGHVIQAGAGQITARQAAVKGGIPMERAGADGEQGVPVGVERDRDGRPARSVPVSSTWSSRAGMESMTNGPYLLPGARAGYRYGDNKIVDATAHDALYCAFDLRGMGDSTEFYSKQKALTREDQDAYSAQSHERALTARKNGLFDDEIVHGDRAAAPRAIRSRSPTTRVCARAPPPRVWRSCARRSPPTARSPPGRRARSPTVRPRWWSCRGRRPRSWARRSWPRSGRTAWSPGPDPSLLSQPSNAILKALGREGQTPADVDLFEINEAFAAVALQSMRDMDIDDSNVNVNGGAISMGHPVGASGARVALHLALELGRRGGGLGAAGLCGGGGQGEALLLHVPA